MQSKITSTLSTLTIMLLGLNPAHAWTINMDFNQGQVGNVIEDKGNSYDVFTDAAGATVYSNCDGNPQDGQCAKTSINQGETGFGTWGGRVTFNEKGLQNLTRGSEVWISVKLFMPIGFDYSANPHLKFLRLHTASASGTNEGYNDLYIKPQSYASAYSIISEVQDAGYDLGTNSDRPQLGTWETYEVYLNLDYMPASQGGTSRIRVWKNGELMKDIDNVQTLRSATSYADSFLIFTYWNGGSPQTQSLYFDDLIITTDRPAARDSFGNPMIGSVLVRPKSPTEITVY